MKESLINNKFNLIAILIADEYSNLDYSIV